MQTEPTPQPTSPKGGGGGGKKILIAAALVIALMFAWDLGSRSAGDAPEPGAASTVVTHETSSTPETEEVEEQAYTETPDEEFNRLVSERFDEEGIPYSSSMLSSARDAAHATCEMLDEGASGIEVAEMLVETASTRQERTMFTIVVGVGVRVYCPQYTSRFES